MGKEIKKKLKQSDYPMKQAIIIAAISATVAQAAPRSSGRRPGAQKKLQQDRAFLNYAS